MRIKEFALQNTYGTKTLFCNKISNSLQKEADLIEACKANDSDAQQIIYELFASKMLSICLRYTRNKDEAQDLMHDAFIKVFLNIKKFRGDSSLETWITRIVINHTLSSLKKEMKRSKDVSIDDVEYKLEGETVEETNDSDVNSQRVLKKMQELPVGYRTILNLYAIENYSHKQIADELGISVGTSKSQLSKARRYLENLLNDKKS